MPEKEVEKVFTFNLRELLGENDDDIALRIFSLMKTILSERWELLKFLFDDLLSGEAADFQDKIELIDKVRRLLLKIDISLEDFQNTYQTILSEKQ